MENKTHFITGLIIILALITNVIVVQPLIMMFAWNIVIVHLFGVSIIGYFGAWGLILLKHLLFNNSFLSRIGEYGKEELVGAVFMKLIFDVVIVIVLVILGFIFGVL